jgi:hypothetical protein
MGSPRVVAREDGLELGDAVGVGGLDAAQPGVVEVGQVVRVAVASSDDAAVHAGRVAVPDLKVHIRDRVAGGYVDDLVVHQERHADLVFGDVFADVLAGDVWEHVRAMNPRRAGGQLTVRPLGDLRGQQAGLVPGKEGRGVGVAGVAQLGLVVVRVQDILDVALLEAALLAGPLDDGLASGNIAGVDTAVPQLVGAVGERGALSGLEVRAALSSLLGDVVTRVGSHEASEERDAGDSFGEKHGGQGQDHWILSWEC